MVGDVFSGVVIFEGTGRVLSGEECVKLNEELGRLRIVRAIRRESGEWEGNGESYVSLRSIKYTRIEILRGE
jgi:hypothetical protein